MTLALKPTPTPRLRYRPAPIPPSTQNGQPIRDAADPRWVLALRTSEVLQGCVLPPERRESLNRLGKIMGLTPFDTALVIAIVQDQARRGVTPAMCPSAGESQLRLIPLPAVMARHRSKWTIALILATVLGAEVLLIAALF